MSYVVQLMIWALEMKLIRISCSDLAVLLRFPSSCAILFAATWMSTSSKAESVQILHDAESRGLPIANF